MAFPHLDKTTEHILKRVAQEIAYEFGLDYVGTEHVLLAILRHNDGLAARILTKHGVTEARAREALEEIVKRQMEDTWVFGRLPGTPNYRNVVELAIDEATQLESKTIGSEHLLLGLLRDDDNAAKQVLKKLGVTLDKCRKEVLASHAKPT